MKFKLRINLWLLHEAEVAPLARPLSRVVGTVVPISNVVTGAGEGPPLPLGAVVVVVNGVTPPPLPLPGVGVVVNVAVVVLESCTIAVVGFTAAEAEEYIGAVADSMVDGPSVCVADGSRLPNPEVCNTTAATELVSALAEDDSDVGWAVVYIEGGTVEISADRRHNLA